MASSLVVSCDGAGQIVLAAGQEVLVGRATTCDLVIGHPEVSGRHLRIRNDGRWLVEDLSSRNGTFLDAERVPSVVVSGAVTLHLARPGRGPRLTLHEADVGGPVAGAAPAEHHTVLRFDRRAPDETPADDGRPVRVRLVIGRARSCDLVVDDDLLVSREHAQVDVLGDGTARVRDLGSGNGTYVDGRRAEPELSLGAGQRLAVGNTVFRFDGGRVERVDLRGDVVFGVEGLVVGTDGARRLDEVSFWLAERSLLAVIGTSGAGKSTLLKAITGSEPADRGRVVYDGRDLYAHYGELRHRIGYVPQDDILHPQLTVAATLRYAARLRFSHDTTAAEREQRVQEVLRELGLEHRADLPVHRLSGGQRKRLSVGLELLPRPSLLILDEPTSGLDPGNERSLMRLLRQLADGGRTVIVVTHATESLHLCDRVLFLARGGVTSFFGPPTALADHFEVRDVADAFEKVDAVADPSALAVAYRASPHAAELRDRAAAGPAVSNGHGVSDGHSATGPDRRAGRRGGAVEAMRQLAIFTARYVRILAGDRRALLILGLQAPLIGLLMLAVFGSGHLDVAGRAGAPTPMAGNVLMALVLGSVYTGASNSVREVVKERSILRREQNFGVSITAYLLSKVVVLGALTLLQSVVLVALGVARQGGPSAPLVFGSGRFELVVSLAVCGLSAMALGLLVSALVSSADKAMTVLPVLLFAQFLLAGLIFPIDKPGLDQVSWLTSARWGLAAVSASADHPALRGCDAGEEAPAVEDGVAAPSCPRSWRHEAGTWWFDVGVLGLLTVGYLGLAHLAIARGDPAATLAKRATVRSG